MPAPTGPEARVPARPVRPTSRATPRVTPRASPRTTPRPPVPPVLSIGVDIGGTKVAAGVVDEAGAIIDRVRVATPSRSPRAVEDTIVAVVEQLRRDHRVQAVGIGAAGWVDTDQAVVRFSPHLAWRSEPLKQKLADRIDLPLIVDNDANAAAWAEYRFGAGQGSSVMVCITLGTGIGGGLVINGQLFRGTYGMAGEWGHMIVVPNGHRCECGNRGCWEQYASGNALVREAREMILAGSPVSQRLLEFVGDVDQLAGPTLTAAAVAGEALATELIADIGVWLGIGIANLVAALDPDLVVIGGGVSESGDLLLAPARQSFARTLTGRGFRPDARIELASFKNDAGLIGAADLARHSMTEPPGDLRGFWPRRRKLRRRARRNALRELRRDAGSLFGGPPKR